MTATNPSPPSTVDLRRLLDRELSQALASRLRRVAARFVDDDRRCLVALADRARLGNADAGSLCAHDRHRPVVDGLCCLGPHHPACTVWSGQRCGWALGGHLHGDVCRRGYHAGLHDGRNGAVCRGRHGPGAARRRSRAAGPGAPPGGPLDDTTRSAHARD